jgi:protease-4
MSNLIDAAVKEGLSSYAVLVALAIVVGAVALPPALAGVAGPDGTIAVVTLDESITGSTADQTVRELRSVRTNDSVDAVVLRVDSGGGGVAGSEAQYRAVKRLAAEKPVVTSVRSTAASGAFYTILPSDAIYAEPSSMVGSVGVIGLLSGSGGVPPSMTTGPDKGAGATMDEFRAQMETMKDSFVSTVLAERGEEITLSRTEIAQAKVYLGARAATNGYVDDVGGLEAAISDVAERAGLDSYSVVYRDAADAPAAMLTLAGSNDSVASPFGTPGVERVNYLMLWGRPTAVEAGSQEVIINASG